MHAGFCSASPQGAWPLGFFISLKDSYESTLQEKTLKSKSVSLWRQTYHGAFINQSFNENAFCRLLFSRSTKRYSVPAIPSSFCQKLYYGIYKPHPEPVLPLYMVFRLPGLSSVGYNKRLSCHLAGRQHTSQNVLPLLNTNTESAKRKTVF